MGEVYRARDPRLGREVAVKVLPEAFAHAPERLRRFEREARAAGALSHPNVLTVFDVGSQNGTHYIVTELLEGETLQDVLRRETPGLRHSLGWMLHVAQGVACAHDAGVLHRDLKPANLFLTRDGRVKILDFGVAKLLQPDAAGGDDTTATTSAGSRIGTAAYMSPEQIRDEPLDARCDVFAMGAILHELVTGRPAFAGSSSSDVMASILRDEPRPLAGKGAAVPPAVEGLVRRCLEKRREDRIGSARELAAALETLVATGTLAAGAVSPKVSPSGTVGVIGSAARSLLEGPRWRAALVLAGLVAVVVAGLTFGRKAPAQPAIEPARVGAKNVISTASRGLRIVVLPFENRGSAEDDKHLATGLTEAVNSGLLNLRGLVVVPRTTARGYKREGKTIPEIGADLGVDFVLEGSVARNSASTADRRVLIAAVLSQVVDEKEVWADRYVRRAEDIFAVQAEVAENVVRAMGVKLLASERTALSERPTKDNAAWDFYVRGLQFTDRSQSQGDQEAALKMYESAVARDPQFTQALARVVRSHAGLYLYHFDRTPARAALAREALARLVAVAPDRAETRIARGYYHYWIESNYARALEELEAALAMQPNNTEVIEGVSYIYRRQGRWEDSAEQSANWLAVDPRSPIANFQHGITTRLLRRYDEADRVFTQATKLNPLFGPSWAYLTGTQLLWRRDVKRAQALLNEGLAVPGTDRLATLLVYEEFRLMLIKRDFDGALRLVDSMKAAGLSNQLLYQPVDLMRGQVHLLTNKQELARKSFEASRAHLVELTKNTPRDPRYWSALGITCAGLGLADEAVRHARHATELMPREKDAWIALWRIEDLALVHTMLGQQNEAIDRLGFLLDATGEISPHVLRLDPRWQSLKTNPVFEELLAKHRDPR